MISPMWPMSHILRIAHPQGDVTLFFICPVHVPPEPNPPIFSELLQLFLPIPHPNPTPSLHTPPPPVPFSRTAQTPQSTSPQLPSLLSSLALSSFPDHCLQCSGIWGYEHDLSYNLTCRRKTYIYYEPIAHITMMHLLAWIEYRTIHPLCIPPWDMRPSSDGYQTMRLASGQKMIINYSRTLTKCSVTYATDDGLITSWTTLTVMPLSLHTSMIDTLSRTSHCGLATHPCSERVLPVSVIFLALLEDPCNSSKMIDTDLDTSFQNEGARLDTNRTGFGSGVMSGTRTPVFQKLHI